MRKIVVFFVVGFSLLVIPIQLRAEDTEEPLGLGYLFEEFSDDKNGFLLKATYLSGFTHGFEMGNIAGRINGSDMGVAFTLKNLEELDISSKEEAKKVMLSAREHAWQRRVTFNFPNPRDMVNELDAFYKTFPLCKRIPGQIILYEIFHIWADDEKKKKTYKEIGEWCLEYKPPHIENDKDKENEYKNG